LESWTREQLGPRAFLRALRKEMPKWSQVLPELPLLMHDLLQKSGRGELSVHWKSAELEKLRGDLRAHHRRLLYAVAGGSLVIAAALLIALGAATRDWLGVPLFSWLCGGAGGALLFMAGQGNNRR
jgi:ubiquinone biosynthesis protein